MEKIILIALNRRKIKYFSSLLVGLRFLAICFGLSVLISVSSLKAQILRDSSSLKLVKDAIDCIYNMRFNDAREICRRIDRTHPEHPAVLLLNGMIIYWERYPLVTTSHGRTDFEDQLRLCIDKCEKYNKENEAEYLLVNLCARGILLLFYSDNNLDSKIFPLGRSTYRYVRRAFEFTQTFPDFYFFTGLYNYYREAYPDAHPVYRSLFFLFPKGDRLKGLKELQIAFEKSIFLRAEASSFLSSNYKYFENNFLKASYFSKTIYNDYPRNIVYRANCIEDLLLAGKYDEAEQLISSDPKSDNRYHQATLNIFRGILNEKKYHDIIRAGQEYTTGAKEISSYGGYGSQYAAYAYFGLSRISAQNNDRHNQRLYRRKALDLTDFRNVNFDEE